MARNSFPLALLFLLAEAGTLFLLPSSVVCDDKEDPPYLHFWFKNSEQYTYFVPYTNAEIQKEVVELGKARMERNVRREVDYVPGPLRNALGKFIHVEEEEEDRPMAKDYVHSRPLRYAPGKMSPVYNIATEELKKEDILVALWRPGGSIVFVESLLPWKKIKIDEGEPRQLEPKDLKHHALQLETDGDTLSFTLLEKNGIGDVLEFSNVERKNLIKAAGKQFQLGQWKNLKPSEGYITPFTVYKNIFVPAPVLREHTFYAYFPPFCPIPIIDPTTKDPKTGNYKIRHGITDHPVDIPLDQVPGSILSVWYPNGPT